MIDIIYITYHIDNLKFSLRALQDLNYNFNLVIHNDNPEIELTEKWLINNCELEKIKYNNLTIINETVNVGMLFSRINAFRSIKNSEYTLFMDDDDYLLIKDLPEFTDYVYYRYQCYKVNTELELVNALNHLSNKVNPVNICGAFWKSDFLSKVFSIIENDKPDFIINTHEDFLIQQIGLDLAIKNEILFHRLILEPGMIYNQIQNQYEKYTHISDNRYQNIINNSEYKNKIDEYYLKLKTHIFENN